MDLDGVLSKNGDDGALKLFAEADSHNAALLDSKLVYLSRGSVAVTMALSAMAVIIVLRSLAGG